MIYSATHLFLYSLPQRQTGAAYRWATGDPLDGQARLATRRTVTGAGPSVACAPFLLSLLLGLVVRFVSAIHRPSSINSFYFSCMERARPSVILGALSVYFFYLEHAFVNILNATKVRLLTLFFLIQVPQQTTGTEAIIRWHRISSGRSSDNLPRGAL